MERIVGWGRAEQRKQTKEAEKRKGKVSRKRIRGKEKRD